MKKLLVMLVGLFSLNSLAVEVGDTLEITQAIQFERRGAHMVQGEGYDGYCLIGSAEEDIQEAGPVTVQITEVNSHLSMKSGLYRTSFDFEENDSIGWMICGDLSDEHDLTTDEINRILDSEPVRVREATNP